MSTKIAGVLYWRELKGWWSVKDWWGGEAEEVQFISEAVWSSLNIGRNKNYFKKSLFIHFLATFPSHCCNGSSVGPKLFLLLLWDLVTWYQTGVDGFKGLDPGKGSWASETNIHISHKVPVRYCMIGLGNKVISNMIFGLPGWDHQRDKGRAHSGAWSANVLHNL